MAAYRLIRQSVSLSEWILNYFGPALDGSVCVRDLKEAMKKDGIVFESEDEFTDVLVDLSQVKGPLKLLFLHPNPPLSDSLLYLMKVTRRNQP